MTQTTNSLKIYYYWHANPADETPVSKRVMGNNYKAIALDRETRRKQGFECGFIYHYTEQHVTFSK